MEVPMSFSLCIHGHFYQPPREDPWLGRILPEASAAPMRHWNERVLRESYAPLAFARRLTGDGKISTIINAYEWMSFNVGPTLLHWLRLSAPEVVERMKEGDRKSLARTGHGNAMAQIYHHVIMPLATEWDKRLETRWAIADFMYHFGRRPEGMWLSECAVDTPTLEVLASEGIGFVVLAPRQAKAVVENGAAIPAGEGALVTGEGYEVHLPSGARITAVFYHGDLSQAIAFQGLLRDGERFWQHIVAGGEDLQRSTASPLVVLGTDGETYGHHSKFGEMALAYAIEQAEKGRDGVGITNIAAHLAQHPPTRQVILHEPSSWSCIHGVERWRSDCGCSDGGHQGWNQQWRGPLRRALNAMRSHLQGHYDTVGALCFKDPQEALLQFGEVLADQTKGGAFAAEWFLPGASGDTCWKLLVMQEQALAAFASCAWFFDDISRIEPRHSLTFALRAIGLARETDATGLMEDACIKEMETILQEAHSNIPSVGTGKDLFKHEVIPLQDDPATLCLVALIILCAQKRQLLVAGETAIYEQPRVSVEVKVDEGGIRGQIFHGMAIIRNHLEAEGTSFTWQWLRPSGTVAGARDFLPISLSEIGVCGADASGQPVHYEAKVGGLARPIQDFILYATLEAMEKKEQVIERAIARHALSLFAPWQEGQTTVHLPQFWGDIAPYLIVEGMLDPNMSGEKLRQLATFLSGQLTSAVLALAQHQVQDKLRAILGHPCANDTELAMYTERVRTLAPAIDLWAVQNSLWLKGVDAFPLFAISLGFR